MSENQGHSNGSGASNLGAPRHAAPAVPVSSSSGARSIRDLLGHDAASYAEALPDAAEESDNPL